MGLLGQVHRGKRPAARRVLLYGVQGIGKSTFGAMAPDAIFLPTEDGQDDIECAKLPVVTSFEQAITALSELYSEPHDFRTLVVDSLDWLERIIWAEVCSKKHVANIEDIGYGKGYAFAIDLWREFIAGLSALRNDRGMMIILIAHSKIEKFQNPEGSDYDKYQPRLHKTAAAIVQEWCDEVLFDTYKTFTAEVKAEFNKTIAKGLGGTDRVMRTTERPAHMAKNRLGLPDELPFSWDSYAQFLK